MNNICSSAAEMDLLPVTRGRCIYRTDEKAIYVDDETRVKFANELEMITEGDLHNYTKDGEWLVQNFGSVWHVYNCPPSCDCGRLIVKKIETAIEMATDPTTIVLQQFIAPDMKMYEHTYTSNRVGAVWTDWAEVVAWKNSTIPVFNGGTGANNVHDALNNLAFQHITTPVQLYMLTAPGVYYMDAGSVESAALVGIPAGYNGWLVVLPNDGTYIKQFWLRRGTQNVNDYQTFVRDIVNGNVSDWKRYAMIDEIDTMKVRSGSLTAYSVSFAIPEGCNRIQVFVCSPDNTSYSDFVSATRLFVNIAEMTMGTGGALIALGSTDTLTFGLSATEFSLYKSSGSTNWNYRIEFLLS